MEDVSAKSERSTQFWTEEFCGKLRPPIRVVTAYIPCSLGVIFGALGSVGWVGGWAHVTLEPIWANRARGDRMTTKKCGRLSFNHAFDMLMGIGIP